MAVWSRYVCAYLAIGFVLFWNVFIWQFEVRAGEWVLISEPYLGMGESSWYFTSRDENLLHIVYVRESQRGNKAEIERVEKERERERERCFQFRLWFYFTRFTIIRLAAIDLFAAISCLKFEHNSKANKIQ